MSLADFEFYEKLMNRLYESPLNEDDSEKTGLENDFKTRIMYILEMPTQGFKSLNKIEEDKDEQEKTKSNSSSASKQ